MAEKQEKPKNDKKKPVKEEKKQVKEEKKLDRREQERADILVRIHGYDINGARNVYVGLTKVKGVSWVISNLVCLKLGIDKRKKIAELTKDEIAKIEEFLKKLDTYSFLKNRRSDMLTGEAAHLYTSDLDVSRDFDIKRLKKIKSWKGLRHSTGQPVRGQRTKSHFRTRGRSTGIKGKGKAGGNK